MIKSNKKSFKQTDRCEKELKNLQIKQKLGEGSYSCVYKVHRISDNQSYAMKKIKLNNLNQKEKENAVNEVRFLASINNPNIVAYKDSIFDDKQNFLYIVMEYMPGGDVLQKLRQYKKQSSFLDENQIWRYFIQITRGVKALHDMKILHRDLKCANIFLSKEGQDAKIGDLNVSKVAKQGLLYTQTGTPYYASPEVWQDKPYNSKSDIWSLGCVLYEMCELHPPFMGQDMKALFKKIKMGTFAPIHTRYSNDLQTLISQCLSINHSKRPSCEQILNNSVVQQKIELLNLNLGSSQSTDCTGSGVNSSSDEVFQKQLLSTIRVGSNLRNLCAKLPDQHYDKINNIKNTKSQCLQNAGNLSQQTHNEASGSQQKQVLSQQVSAKNILLEDDNYDFQGQQLAVVKQQRRKQTMPPPKRINIQNMFENKYPVANDEILQKQNQMNQNVQNIINNQYVIQSKQNSIKPLIIDENINNKYKNEGFTIRKCNSNRNQNDINSSNKDKYLAGYGEQIIINSSIDIQGREKSQRSNQNDSILENYVNLKQSSEQSLQENNNSLKPPIQQVRIHKGHRNYQKQQNQKIQYQANHGNQLSQNSYHNLNSCENQQQSIQDDSKIQNQHESLDNQNSFNHNLSHVNNNSNIYENKQILPKIQSQKAIDDDRFPQFSKNLNNIQSAKKNYINVNKQQSCFTLDDVNYSEVFSNYIKQNQPQSQKNSQKKQLFTEDQDQKYHRIQSNRVDLSSNNNNSRKFIFKSLASEKILPPNSNFSQQNEQSGILKKDRKSISMNNSKQIQDLNFSKKSHKKNQISNISIILQDQNNIEDFINQIQQQPYQIKGMMKDNFQNQSLNNSSEKQSISSNNQNYLKRLKNEQSQSSSKQLNPRSLNNNYKSSDNNNIHSAKNFDQNSLNVSSKKNKIEFNPLFMPNSGGNGNNQNGNRRDFNQVSEVAKVPRMGKQNRQGNLGIFFSEKQIQN